MTFDPTVDLVLRLVIASLAGAVLGFEREVRNHVAGVRTHALVALGAALFTVAGAYGFTDLARAPTIDPARVAAQVASGIGFIGAGAILRNGFSVRGLTTAATLWLGAALGVAAGAGQYLLVCSATVLMLGILMGLQILERVALRMAPCRGSLEVRYTRGHGTVGPLLRSLELVNARLTGVTVEDDDDEALEPGIRVVKVHATFPQPADLEPIWAGLEARKEVERVDWIPDVVRIRQPQAAAAARELQQWPGPADVAGAGAQQRLRLRRPRTPAAAPETGPGDQVPNARNGGDTAEGSG